MLATVDWNLILRMAMYLSVFAFLLVVASVLTQTPSHDVTESNMGLLSIAFAIPFIVANARKKGATQDVSKLMMWAVIIMAVAFFAFILWGVITGDLGKNMSYLWVRIFPF